MIEIAHEAPVSLMRKMAEVTDYDYALACLFDRVPGYYDYFVEALANGRKVILDNGVFEDGVAMDAAEYAGWIAKLKPTEYIVPDVFDNTVATIENYMEWKETYKDLPGIAIGVCQGSTPRELHECYDWMSKHADKIALNFASIAYQQLSKDFVRGDISWDRYAVMGRVSFIYQLVLSNRFNAEKPHHLLGCSLPQEFDYLKDTIPFQSNGEYNLLDYFETMDTSAPVVWGLLVGEYPDDLTEIEKKNKTKLKDLITANISEEQTRNIFTNVDKFRNYLS